METRECRGLLGHPLHVAGRSQAQYGETNAYNAAGISRVYLRLIILLSCKNERVQHGTEGSIDRVEWVT